MPSPFSDKPQQPVERSTGAVVTHLKITNSELWCDQCSAFASEGDYVREAKRLSFTCPNGHDNVVRGIEINE